MSKLEDIGHSADSAIQGWLMDIPDNRASRSPISIQRSDVQMLNEESHYSKVELNCNRPSSILSISSEDSVNLEELISANFTTNVDEEIDLSEFSLLDLVDDSSEEFWKLNNIPDRLFAVPNPNPNPSQLNSNGTSYENRNDLDRALFTNEGPLYESNSDLRHSFKAAAEYSIDEIHKTKLNDVYYKEPSLPYNIPLTIATDMQHRNDRSGSFSSENSSTTQSTSTTTVRSNGCVQPTTSTSTSTIKASMSITGFRGGSKHDLRTSTAVSPSLVSQHSITRQAQKGKSQRKPSKIPGIAEHSAASAVPRFLQSSQLTIPKRATHIPSFSVSATDTNDTKPSSLIPLPSKSSVAKKSKLSSRDTLWARSANTNQPFNTNTTSSAGTNHKRRASHIPTLPTRSTTSFSMSRTSSIFSSPSNCHQRSSQAYSSTVTAETNNTRPQTALSSRQPAINISNIRSTSMLKMPSASKSTGLGLRKPGSRNF